MATKQFKTSKRKKTPITFDLDGTEVVFTPGKTASMMLPVFDHDDETMTQIAAMRSQFDWFQAGLKDSVAQKIVNRLRDEKDDLDFDDVMEIIVWLQEEVTGNPTGSTSGS